MDTNELNVRVTFNRRSALAALTAFFLCWRPGFIGSESLQLTTYYPAPYGGYVSLLTTNNTRLARDGGTVGIRTGNNTPRAPLDVAGEVVAVSRFTMAQDTGSSSLTWHIDNSGGRFRIFQQPNIATAGVERLTILNGGNVGVGTSAPGDRLTVSGGNLRVENGNMIIQSGNLTFTNSSSAVGFITGLCSTVGYGSGTASCPAGMRVMATYGTTSCTSGGLLFRGGDLQNPGRWFSYIIEGCAGSMLCCRVRDW